MTRKDIIRAWKDEEYRENLSGKERAMLPENPVGPVELRDADLDYATGSGIRRIIITKLTRYC